MNRFCTDRDLLATEPSAFAADGFGAAALASGTSGGVSGTTFSASGVNFTAAGVEAGMVLTTSPTIPAEGDAWEIVSVDSPTTLTVSILRADPESAAVAPPAASGLSFFVRTFAARIVNVSEAMAEKLRRITEAAGIASSDFADSNQLRRAAVLGTLAELFRARAENARTEDAHWTKAEYYQNEFLAAQNRLRLAVDLDGDGRAEETRSLGNVLLRRV